MELLSYGDQAESEEEKEDINPEFNLKEEKIENILKRWEESDESDSEDEEKERKVEEENNEKNKACHNNLISVNDLFMKDIPVPSYIQRNDVEGYKVELLSRYRESALSN